MTTLSVGCPDGDWVVGCVDEDGILAGVVGSGAGVEFCEVVTAVSACSAEVPRLGGRNMGAVVSNLSDGIVVGTSWSACLFQLFPEPTSTVYVLEPCFALISLLP